MELFELKEKFEKLGFTTFWLKELTGITKLCVRKPNSEVVNLVINKFRTVENGTVWQVDCFNCPKGNFDYFNKQLQNLNSMFVMGRTCKNPINEVK